MNRFVSVFVFFFIGLSIHVNAQNPPDAAFQYSPSGCLGMDFTDISTPGSDPIDLWFWDFGDGNFSTMQSPSHTYATEGLYSVWLFVSAAGNTDTTRKFINVLCCNSDWQYDAVSNCPTVDFTDNSTTLSGTLTDWAWTFGDGNVSSMQSPSHTYATGGGTYNVCLTTTSDNGCMDTHCDNITLSCMAPPTVPTLSQWGLILFSLLLLVVGTVALRSRRLSLIRDSKP
jgi:PKD repeat protein